MSRRRTARDLEQLPTPIAPWHCPSGKHGYASREDAQTWLAYLQRTRGDDAEKVEAREYRCANPSCARYHLTSDAHRRTGAAS